MKINNMRSFKASLIVLCSILGASFVAADADVSSELGAPITETGSLCEDTTAITLPTDGSLNIISGSHSKLFSFLDCSYYQQTSVTATVYQVEGTGTMLDVSLFSGPFGSSSEVAVFEGCPSETDTSGNEDKLQYGGPVVSNCVEGQYYQGARFQAKAGQLYTIVVFSLVSLSSTDFILRVAAVEKKPFCSETGVEPIDLGIANTTSGSLQRFGGPENSVLVTDLPQCDLSTQSSSVLYKIKVSEPDVSVSVYAEGDDSFVSVYEGNCESGYSCVAPMNVGYNYPMYDVASMNPGTVATGSPIVAAPATESPEVIADDDEFDEPPTGAPKVDYTSMPRDSNSRLTFHNAEAGTTYLISVNSCCGADVSDFRLTVNTTKYGDVCEDSAAADLSRGNFSASINLSRGKTYKDLYSCHAEVNYEETYTVTGPDHATSSTSTTNYVMAGTQITGPTVFYEITGDGNSYVAYATHSNPNTYYGQVRMALFTTSSCDEAPQCLQGDNYNNFISIDTTAGQTYYLAVYNEYPDSKASFDLIIAPVSSKTPCEDAIDLGAIGSAGLAVNGTTKGASFFKDLMYCNFYSTIARGRVYSFVSEVDGPVMASVKVDQMNFYPQVTVATACGNDQCVTGLTSFEVEPMSPSAVWTAESGVTYYVLVMNSYDWSAAGTFKLTLEPLETTRVCESENAISLGTIPNEGALFDGSLVSAPLFSLPKSCQQKGEETAEFRAVTRAATFTLTGDGNAYTFSVSDAYSFSPQATVLKGDCDSLQCVPTNSYSSSFLLGTEQGETYTILIGDCCSATPNEGTFKLHAKKVTSGKVTQNVTETIDSFANETQVIFGSTSSGLFYPGLPMCSNPIDSPATVYKLDTGAGFFTAKISGFGFEAQVSLFESDGSGGLECYGSHIYREVSWQGEEGKSLYLVVHGCCDMNAVGDYALRFTTSSNSGDPCDNVTDLGNVTEGGLMHVGSVEGWSYLAVENETLCDFTNNYIVYGGPSKVFTVVGNGKSVVASTFITQSTANQGIQLSVTVLKGVCGSLECIDGAHSDSSMAAMSITWPSVEGETYDIVVSTYSSQIDDEFVLMVYEEGTKMYGYGYPLPVYPLEGDSSVANDNAVTDSGESDESDGTGETINTLNVDDSSSSHMVGGISLLLAFLFTMTTGYF